MWINACYPLLKINTILDIVNFFNECPSIEGLHCVQSKKNWFWNKDGLILNPDKKPNIHTQNMSPIYESVHCLHIYKRKYLLDNERYWSFTKDDPYLYVVDEDVQFLDIDTQLEFDILEEIWTKD